MTATAAQFQSLQLYGALGNKGTDRKYVDIIKQRDRQLEIVFEIVIPKKEKSNLLEKRLALVATPAPNDLFRFNGQIVIPDL